MTVIIRKTIPEDAEILAKIWLESLQDNEMVKIASPEGITPERLQGATKRTSLDLENSTALSLTACDKESGTVMGCAVWRYYPDGKKEELSTEASQPSKEAEVPESQESNKDEATGNLPYSQQAAPTKPDIGTDLDTASKRIFQNHVGERPHACTLNTLSKLQVSPYHERKGVASALMKHGLEQTNLPCYHFSTPKASKLYEKHGYREIDRVVLSLADYGGPEGELYISPFYYRPGTIVKDWDWAQSSPDSFLGES